MAVAAFLYLNALADSFTPCRKFQDGFAIWLERKSTLFAEVGAESTIIAMEHLMELRPDLSGIWREGAAQQAQRLARCVEQGVWEEGEGIWRNIAPYGCGMVGFAAAHRLWPEGGYDRLAWRQLETCTRREQFYHVRRGLAVSELPAALRGDDYRDMFHYQPHTAWMRAYWQLVPQRLNSPKSGCAEGVS